MNADQADLKRSRTAPSGPAPRSRPEWRTGSAARLYASLAEFLPPMTQPHRGEWLNRFIDDFDRLAARIVVAEGEQDSLATDIGEELALHLIIDLAETSCAN